MNAFKIITSIAGMMIGMSALYLAFTVPSFLATPYLIVTLALGAVTYIAAKDLSTKFITGLGIGSVVWLVMLSQANG